MGFDMIHESSKDKVKKTYLKCTIERKSDNVWIWNGLI